MSVFRFAEIRLDVDRRGPNPQQMTDDLYTVRLTGPEGTGWIENVVSLPRKDRTSATDFALASESVALMAEAARDGKLFYITMRRYGNISPEEVKATIHLAEELKEYLPDAMAVALDKQPLYSEYREGNVGPLEFEIRGRRRR